VWLNIKNFQLPEGLSHKFLDPYVGPFKVLKKKLFDTYKLKLPENLRVHHTFHVSLLKSITRDVSRLNREHNVATLALGSRPKQKGIARVKPKGSSGVKPRGCPGVKAKALQELRQEEARESHNILPGV